MQKLHLIFVFCGKKCYSKKQRAPDYDRLTKMMSGEKKDES